MSSLTREEGIQLDKERVQFVDQVMSRLGFRQHLFTELRTGPYYKFTNSIIYLDDQSGDSVSVCFPFEDQVERRLEITTQAKFNDRIESPEWKSLYEVKEKIGSWIEECRGKEQPHG